jgi:hypothetical protein
MMIRRPQAEPIAPRHATDNAPPMSEDIPMGVDPLMISSLPSMASGADVYMRQFYRNSRLPSRRYLPLRSK